MPLQQSNLVSYLGRRRGCLGVKEEVTQLIKSVLAPAHNYNQTTTRIWQVLGQKRSTKYLGGKKRAPKVFWGHFIIAFISSFGEFYLIVFPIQFSFPSAILVSFFIMQLTDILFLWIAEMTSVFCFCLGYLVPSHASHICDTPLWTCFILDSFSSVHGELSAPWLQALWRSLKILGRACVFWPVPLKIMVPGFFSLGENVGGLFFLFVFFPPMVLWCARVLPVTALSYIKFSKVFF